MKLCKFTVVFVLSAFAVTMLAQTPTQNGMYWPTGSSTNTSQYFADQSSIFGGNWLEPGCILSGTTCADYRDIQDPSDATKTGQYFAGKYHLGFDILNPTGVQHQPIYAIADGQIVRVSYDGWGAGSCSEAQSINAFEQAPTCTYTCGDNATFDPNGPNSSDCPANVALVVRHVGSDGNPFYAVYGHLVDLNQSPREMPGTTFSSTAPRANTCDPNDYLTATTTGVETADRIALKQKRPFHACDIILAGELLGYTGHWSHGRHLHFSIAPYVLPITSLGRASYDSSNWPSNSFTPSNDYVAPSGSQTLGTYHNQVNPIAYITDTSNAPNNWIQSAGIGVTPTSASQGACWIAWNYNDPYYGIVTSMSSNPPSLSVVNGLPTLTFTGTIVDDGGNNGLFVEINPYPPGCIYGGSTGTMYSGYRFSNVPIGTHTISVSYDYQNQMLYANVDGGTVLPLSTKLFPDPVASISVCMGWLGCAFGSGTPDYLY